MLTSVDREGTRHGYDLDLIAAVAAAIGSVPLIASGGMGSCADMVAAFRCGADAAAWRMCCTITVSICSRSATRCLMPDIRFVVCGKRHEQACPYRRYGIGNLYSVARAMEKAGGEARLSNDPSEIASAERLLPAWSLCFLWRYAAVERACRTHPGLHGDGASLSWHLCRDAAAV